VDVVLVNGADLRHDLALGLGSRIGLDYVAGADVFPLAAEPARNVGAVVIDVDADSRSPGLIRQLRVVFPEVRIVALATGRTAPAARGAGATVVLVKPVSSVVLAATIRRLTANL
jgi:DNA-binding NarL/FixJ family response regulator